MNSTIVAQASPSPATFFELMARLSLPAKSMPSKNAAAITGKALADLRQEAEKLRPRTITSTSQPERSKSQGGISFESVRMAVLARTLHRDIVLGAA